MKLISVNVEGKKHEIRVFSLLEKEQPDVVCLQEAPKEWCEKLHEQGYHCTFAPMLLRKEYSFTKFTEGIIFASRHAHTAETHYYYKSAGEIVFHEHRVDHTTANPVIIGRVQFQGQQHTIAVTHLMVTPDGLPSDHQSHGLGRLLDILSEYEPHVICGDFNIPRNINVLYGTLTERYTDCIPKSYTSSLDRTLHRSGSSTTLNAPIFDTYMVDYIFTQPPYKATDTRLEFGVSDHAAIIATISQ